MTEMFRFVRIFILHKSFYLITVILLSTPVILRSQSLTYSGKLQWNATEKIKNGDESIFSLISFDGSSEMTDMYGALPVFSKRFALPEGSKQAEVRLVNEKYTAFRPEEIRSLRDREKIGCEIGISTSVVTERKESFLLASFLPLRKNSYTGMLEKMVSFDLVITWQPGEEPELRNATVSYADHSVLATGSWYRLQINARGIYKISYEDLVNMGIDPASVNPRNIRIFGNGGGMLPESNAIARIDDLQENSILVAGEDDGQFNNGDYVLFYAEPPDSWSWNSKDNLFHHSKNCYSDNAFYFLTIDNGPGRRIGSHASSAQSATETITKFNDYAFYEKDDINLIKSGREWYDGEIFDITTSRQYSFGFPDLDLTSPAILKADVAARCTSGPTSFSILSGSQAVMSIPVASTSAEWLSAFGKKGIKTDTIIPAGSTIDLKVNFNKNGQEASGYLNYLEVNVVRNLKMSGSQMNFRSPHATGAFGNFEYQLASGGSNLTIWDVTSRSDIKRIEPAQTGADYVFRLEADTMIHELVAFDGSGFNSVISASRIENQDLHGSGDPDYIIITHPDFLTQAEDLAEFHREHDHFNVLVTTPDKVYNEFSSGAQDITAIRDFMRMIYNRAVSAKKPKYLLLFGDASYDYKDRVANNTNFIPSYESPESLDPIDSYVSDDYFVLLDPAEGQGATGALDIGVGRFIVQTVAQAEEAVAKIKHYCENSDTVKNDWRNVISFVAEDWDNNLHLNQTEEITSLIDQNYKEYNVDKIYLDAYQAITTPGGLRNPDVNDAINKRMGKGALIMNYTGHGGELGWAHERVLEIPDIKSWTNFNNMPAFMTATCEFSRFDDPAFVSAGEWVFLNPSGGGIALFTTTRATFAGSNSALSHNFYNNVFEKIDGDYPKMGDLIVEAKNATGGSANSRKFVLLGDPALRLAYPEENVVTTSINEKPVSGSSDTIRALSEITIAGEIRASNGNILTGFNGTLFPTVFDKVSDVVTVGNTGGPITTFEYRKNVIYKGKVNVSEGKFNFTFIVPKDIAYQYGQGKISYYARSYDTDANGYEDNIIVGGYNNDALVDDKGPDIRLYMNTTDFINGGLTDQNPDLLAVISDTSGINTVGNGIGHDLTAILDGNSQDAKILNDYYVTDLNTFKSGVVVYPFTNLSDGPHTIVFKAWDVHNNSSEATIDFVVVSSANIELQDLMNYPNPFNDYTTFSFEFNQSSGSLEAEIRIYSLQGMLIRTLRETFIPTGYLSRQIEWDGTTYGGQKIGGGTYVYVLTLTASDGSSVHKTSKMVILR
jgi:hypothetical protein